MASLSLKHIYKVYDGTTKAVNDFNMEIRDKEVYNEMYNRLCRYLNIEKFDFLGGDI